MKRQKGEVATIVVVLILASMFGVLVTNGGKNLKSAEADTVQVAEAK